MGCRHQHITCTVLLRTATVHSRSSVTAAAVPSASRWRTFVRQKPGPWSTSSARLVSSTAAAHRAVMASLAGRASGSRVTLDASALL